MIVINEPLAVLATLAIIVFGKSAAAFLLVKMFGHSKRTALTISASLAQIGEFAFILAGLGIALGMMSEHGRNLVLAGAILSIMLNPLLFTLLERYLAKTETIEEQILEEAVEEEKQIPVDMCNHALVVGYGRVGSLLGGKLAEAGIPLVVIENSRPRVEALREQGIKTVLGNAANPEVMDLARLDCARWLLLTIPNGYEAGGSSPRRAPSGRTSDHRPRPLRRRSGLHHRSRRQPGGDGRTGDRQQHAEHPAAGYPERRRKMGGCPI